MRLSPGGNWQRHGAHSHLPGETVGPRDDGGGKGGEPAGAAGAVPGLVSSDERRLVER